MALTVPYNPVPSVEPVQRGEQRFSVNTPGAAFGENIAQAVEGLGQTMQHSGDELFTRALAMQQLKNESDARDADAQYMVTAGEKHAKFSALEGKDAVDAYPAYAKDLQDTRKQFRDNLKTDQARKMFDSQSLSTMGRSIFNGAGHAATQNKIYAIGSNKAQVEAYSEAALANPKDDVAFQDYANQTRDRVAEEAELRGWSNEQADQATDDAVSKLWSKRIMGLSRSEPNAAARMMEANKDSLTGSDYFKVENAVRGQSRAVGSVNIANGVYAAGQPTDDKPGKTLAEMETEVKAKAAEIDPDDPILAQHAITALRGQWNQSKYAVGQEKITNIQTISAGIQSGVQNIQELRTDPKVAAAIDALPAKDQLAIPGQINRYNDAKNKVTNQDNYQRLYGMSNNDVEQFLNTDVTKEQLSQQDMRKLQEQQRKLKEMPNADPRVNRAVGQIRTAMGTQLEALGIYKRTDGNKDDYDKFTGAVQGALDVWQETHGKPATYKDITDTIGPQVIRQTTEPGRFWGTNKVPYFKQSVPEAFTKASKDFATSQGQVEPTEEQIQKDFTRTQFMRLYEKKSSD